VGSNLLHILRSVVAGPTFRAALRNNTARIRFIR
jgi:hypothetical protein